MENKQTAVEWIVKEIESLITIETFQRWKVIKEQAKQMEKQQMHKIAEYWHFNGIADEYFDDYYDEIFGK